VEKSPDDRHQSFLATKGRMATIRKIVRDFAGVEVQEAPSRTPNDFMSHVNLGFQTAEQRHVFFDRMFQLDRQELNRSNCHKPSQDVDF
jgi:hypothetical protein